MLRILTDSAADFSVEEASRLNIELLPLSILFGDKVYYQEGDPGFQRFYQMLQSSAQIPSTSQATPQDYLERFEAARKAGDDILAVTLSSGLSSTYQSGLLAKQQMGSTGIEVVDGQSAVMGQRILVEHALKLRDQGQSAKQIADTLTALRDRVRIYAVLDTLEYLRKGGRIPKSAAFIGTLLNVKPVIMVKDGVVGMAGKARGSAAGVKMMFDRIELGPKIDTAYPVYFGYSTADGPCRKFQAEACARYALPQNEPLPIGGVIGTHVGPGVMAIAFIERA